MFDNESLKKYGNYTFEKSFEYRKNSFIGCGGVAEFVFYPQTVNELVSLVSELRKDKFDYYVLGNLSNVLPPDGVSKRIVVRTKNLRNIDFENGVSVSAGVTVSALLRACRLVGKSGCEFLTGIPATMGGLLYMNGGAAGRYIAEIVEGVIVLREGKRNFVPFSECRYAYKSSVFMTNEDVILGAKLRLSDSETERVETQIRRYGEKRAHLPKGKSMGCIFKNPDTISAGKLIEDAGLKGLRVGGAVVSEVHANFILNDGSATSSQIKSLIEIVKNAVYAQYKLRLQEEIRYLE